MGHRITSALFAISCLALAAAPARAQQEIRYPPGYDSNAPRAEAADQALGMAPMSASVQFDGTLQAGGGVVSSVRDSRGFYLVTFDRSVEACTCTASFGNHNGGAVASLVQNFISANCPISKPNVVAVWIQLNGVNGNASFHLMVFCPR